MTRNILIHTRNLKIPGGKQTYLKALQDHSESTVSYFFYGTMEPVKESPFAFLKRFFTDYIKFYRLLKRGKFDLVHINTSLNPKSYFRDSIFTLISKMLRYKTVVYWHGWKWDFERKYASKIVPYFHFTFGKADAMICLANEFADKLASYRYKNPVYLETTLVEDQIMDHPTVKTLVTMYKTPSILFLSRVEEAKGIYETLDSFKKLKIKFPHISLNIAGTGSELERVKHYVEWEKIQAVNFLGWVNGEEKIRILSEADIFVLASYSEGMPICVLEAMAMGLPVVTTNVGGIKDFFEDGQMGFKVRTKDAEDLKDKLEKLLSRADLRERIGSFNRDYAQHHFSSKDACKRLEHVYENVIEDIKITSRRRFLEK